jgi:hypothetical protein
MASTCTRRVDATNARDHAQRRGPVWLGPGGALVARADGRVQSCGVSVAYRQAPNAAHSDRVTQRQGRATLGAYPISRLGRSIPVPIATVKHRHVPVPRECGAMDRTVA